MNSIDIDSIFANIEEFEIDITDKAAKLIVKYEVIANQLRNAAHTLKVYKEQLEVAKQNFGEEQKEFKLLRGQSVLLRCDRCKQQLYNYTVNEGFDHLFNELRLDHQKDLGATPNTRFDITDSKGLRLWYSSYRKPAKSRPFTEEFRAPHITCFEDGFGYLLESEGLSLLIKLNAIRREDKATGKKVSLPIWEVFSSTRDRWVPWMIPIFSSVPLNSKYMTDISCPRIVMPNNEEISRGVMWVLLFTEERFGISFNVGNPQLSLTK